MAIAEFAVPVKELDAIEKRVRNERLVAITHGDPTKTESCGRPITYRATRITERRSADSIAVCPVHGDLVADDGKTGGYTGAFAFFAEDARSRRKSE